MKLSHFIYLMFILTGLFSCQDSDRDEDIITNSATDYATGQSMAIDLFKIVHQAAISSNGIVTTSLNNNNSIFGCDSLIVDTLSNPRSIIIRFGSSCTNRSGEIIATFSNRYDITNTQVSVSLVNYTYENLSITAGNMSIVNNGVINNQLNYSYNVNQLNIENSQLANITWSGNQTIINTAGNTTFSFLDDAYTLSGIANGNTFRGNNFNASIVTDLTFSGNCNWISSGTVNVSPENKTLRTLNFGSGCDNNGIVSIFDADYEINY